MKLSSERKVFPTEDEAQEYAEDNGYNVDKTVDTSTGCTAYLRKRPIDEARSSYSDEVYKALNRLNIPYENISEEDDVVYVSSSEPYSHQTLDKVYASLAETTGAGFEDKLHTMWFSF